VREVVRRWEDHHILRKWMFSFFRYIDRFWVKRHARKSLLDVATSRFRIVVFDRIKDRLSGAILDTIRRDRDGEEVDRETLRKAVLVYVELGSARVYQSELEKPMLEAAREYFTRESASWISADTCPDYLRKCEVTLDAERARVRDYLIATTEPALIAVRNGSTGRRLTLMRVAQPRRSCSLTRFCSARMSPLRCVWCASVWCALSGAARRAVGAAAARAVCQGEHWRARPIAHPQ
jgi:hypothetical protein